MVQSTGITTSRIIDATDLISLRRRSNEQTSFTLLWRKQCSTSNSLSIYCFIIQRTTRSIFFFFYFSFECNRVRGSWREKERERELASELVEWNATVHSDTSYSRPWLETNETRAKWYTRTRNCYQSCTFHVNRARKYYRRNGSDPYTRHTRFVNVVYRDR